MIPIRRSSVQYSSFNCIFYSFIFNRLCHPSFRTSTSRQLLATLTIRFVFRKNEIDIAFTSLFKGMFWSWRRDGTHRWSPFHPPGPQDPQFQWWVKTSSWASWDLPRIQVQCHGLPSLFHLLWPGNRLITLGFVSHKSFNSHVIISVSCCAPDHNPVCGHRRGRDDVRLPDFHPQPGVLALGGLLHRVHRDRGAGLHDILGHQSWLNLNDQSYHVHWVSGPLLATLQQNTPFIHLAPKQILNDIYLYKVQIGLKV